MATTVTPSKVESYLGAKAEFLLGFKSPTIPKEKLHLPGPDFIDRMHLVSDRNRVSGGNQVGGGNRVSSASSTPDA